MNYSYDNADNKIFDEVNINKNKSDGYLDNGSFSSESDNNSVYNNSTKFPYVYYFNESTIVITSHNSFEAIQYAIDMSKDGDNIVLLNNFFEGMVILLL